MAKYFFFGQVLRDSEDGHKRVTMSDSMRIEGGSQDEHEKAVEIVTKFGERVRKHGIEHAGKILENVVKEINS